jgi:hypothetical protein
MFPLPALRLNAPARTLLAALVLAAPAASAQVLGPRPQQQEQQAAPDWRSVLTGLNLKPTGELTRKKHYSEVEAVTEDGRTVTVSFDRQGRIAEIEDETHEHPERVSGAPDPQAAVEAARRAGFVNPVVQEHGRRRTTVRARTATGDVVDLHIDRAGWIYRQVWVRG